MENIIDSFLSELLCRLQRSKRSFYALISLLSLCLLAYNSASIFCTQVPIAPRTPPEPASFLPENVAGKSRKFFSLPSAENPSFFAPQLSESVKPSAKLKAHFSLLHKNRNFVVSTKRSDDYQPKRRRRRKIAEVKPFEVRVREFFNANSPHSFCKFRFFMTWISSVESFGEREMFAISSLFKAHPNGCLIIASDSLDSRDGMQILKPFLNKGFRVTSISPNFDFLFKGTPAETWYNQLMLGNVNTGEVALGQNLSNLLRLGLLYRFGGIYLDTDVIVLKNLGELRNVIGAQTIDLDTGNWSRLNNAVMIFDEGHPLLYKFIQEFALTFDGNKWGHNGPYLVSRVVARVSGRPGYDFTVLPPMAFYPVDWSRIRGLFEGPRSLSHSKWLVAKLRQIRSQSFAVHLWNKQSRGFEVEKGSVIQHLMFSSGVEQ
ncbi:alpha 1 [Perilla frutescens var. hirtella]|nr:alpha 1 [Perilla frutescens var. hirtella]